MLTNAIGPARHKLLDSAAKAPKNQRLCPALYGLGVCAKEFGPMLNVLFVCSQNKLRSPTAEQVFADWPGIQTASAGLNHDAEVPLGPELVQWAGLIVVMETRHREKLRKRFKALLNNQQIVCLNIPDDYDFMDPELIQLLRQKVPPFLPDGDAAR
ncbi:phosphatase [Pseudomonas sp. St29]|nr:phosphatase [Pseudomonas sp. St29]